MVIKKYDWRTLLSILIIVICFSSKAWSQETNIDILQNDYTNCINEKKDLQSAITSLEIKTLGKDKEINNLKLREDRLRRQINLIAIDNKIISEKSDTITKLKESIEKKLSLIKEMREKGVQQDSLIKEQKDLIVILNTLVKAREQNIEDLQLKNLLLRRELEVSRYLIGDFIVSKNNKSDKGALKVQFNLKSAGMGETVMDTALKLHLKLRQSAYKGIPAKELNGWITFGASGSKGAHTVRTLNYSIPENDSLVSTVFSQVGAFSSKRLKSNNYELVIFFKSNSGDLVPIDTRQIHAKGIRYYPHKLE